MKESEEQNVVFISREGDMCYVSKMRFGATIVTGRCSDPKWILRRSGKPYSSHHLFTTPSLAVDFNTISDDRLRAIPPYDGPAVASLAMI